MEHVRLPLLPREYLVQVKACAERSPGPWGAGQRTVNSPAAFHNQLLPLRPFPVLINLLPPIFDLGKHVSGSNEAVSGLQVPVNSAPVLHIAAPHLVYFHFNNLF